MGRIALRGGPASRPGSCSANDTNAAEKKKQKKKKKKSKNAGVEEGEGGVEYVTSRAGVKLEAAKPGETREEAADRAMRNVLAEEEWEAGQYARHISKLRGGAIAPPTSPTGGASSSAGKGKGKGKKKKKKKGR